MDTTAITALSTPTPGSRSSHKAARAETQLLAHALFDYTPDRRLAASHSASVSQRARPLPSSASAKALDQQIANMCLLQPDPALSLRTVTTSERKWSMDDAFHELTYGRMETHSLLMLRPRTSRQPLAAPPAKRPTNPARSGKRRAPKPPKAEPPRKKGKARQLGGDASRQANLPQIPPGPLQKKQLPVCACMRHKRLPASARGFATSFQPHLKQSGGRSGRSSDGPPNVARAAEERVLPHIKGGFLLDVFAGIHAPISAAADKQGLSRFEAFGLEANSEHNILDDACFELLMRISWSGIVSLITLAPPCKEYSRLKLRLGGPKAFTYSNLRARRAWLVSRRSIARCTKQGNPQEEQRTLQSSCHTRRRRSL